MKERVGMISIHAQLDPEGPMPHRRCPMKGIPSPFAQSFISESDRENGGDSTTIASGGELLEWWGTGIVPFQGCSSEEVGGDAVVK